MEATLTIDTAEAATQRAQADTLLTPRFYTTDFAAMDRIDVTPVRAEWDQLMAKFRRDTNRNHFERPADFAGGDPRAAGAAAPGVPRLPRELGDGGVLRLRALQRDQAQRDEPRDPRADGLDGARREPARRLHQQVAEGLRTRRGPRLPHQGEEVHLLPPEVHLLRHLPLGEDRLRALHHDLPPARAAPGAPLPPDLQVVRAVVQRRVPPRRGVRAAACAPTRSCSTGLNKLWIRFFLLAVYATMYVRDHTRPALHKALWASTRPSTTTRSSGSPPKSRSRCSR